MSVQTNLRSIEILLVEDNLSDIRLTTEILRECGMLVNLNVVRDGEEALCYLRRTVADPEVPRPTLILLDLNLPKKNGFEVLDEVKSDPVLRRIPVIVLTTSTAERDITRSYDLHANCYISKAARLENLIELLQSINGFWFQMVKYSTESGGIDE